jgi:hypothetical protein
MLLQGQSILSLVPHKDSFVASPFDGYLSGTFRTLRTGHDLVSKLIESERLTLLREATLDIGGSHLVPRSRLMWCFIVGRLKPESARVEAQKLGLLSRSVSELETKFDGIVPLVISCEQHIGIPDGVQCGGASEGSSNLIPIDGLADMMHDDQRGL